MTPGAVIWITGLSGAGKTTLAKHVARRLRDQGTPVVLLDGDAMRDLMEPSPGHTREERLAVAKYFGRLCRFISMQGVTVVCSTISLFHDVQEWNRKNIPGYFEVHVRVPIETLIARDPNALYGRAKRGEVRDVVGIDIHAEEPKAPDWVWNNDFRGDVEAQATQILQAARRSGKL